MTFKRPPINFIPEHRPEEILAIQSGGEMVPALEFAHAAAYFEIPEPEMMHNPNKAPRE